MYTYIICKYIYACTRVFFCPPLTRALFVNRFMLISPPRRYNDDDHGIIFYRFTPWICRKKITNPVTFIPVYFIEKFNKLLEKFRHYVKSNYATVLVSIVLFCCGTVISADWNWKTIVSREYHQPRMSPPYMLVDIIYIYIK